MENTFAEFPEHNFRRALACLNRLPLQEGNVVSYERLDAKVSAFGAYGVHDHIEVTLDFKPNAGNRTMQLDISAEAFKSVQ